jgi:pilus assembly protein CpaB
MRPKSLALLMLALGCGLVASIGITELIARRNANSGATGDTQSIFVAMSDIGLGDLLTAQVLKLEQWPKDKVPPGAVSRIEDVEGRRARTKLYAGEAILETRLLGKGASEQGATALIPKGYRVVPVKVDLVSGGSSLILPGDRVDVMVHLVRDPGREIQETVTRTILQDVKVFAVDNIVDLEKDKEGNNKSLTAKTISLLVTPEQAAKVMLATQMGIINLVMRSPEDDLQGPNVQARPGELFGGSIKKTEREKETLLASPEPSLKEKTTSLLEFLNSMKTKAGGPVIPMAEEAKARETWNMRILKPGDVDQVQFELEDSKSAATSPFGGWKTTTVASSSDPANSGKAESRTAPPPAAGPPLPQPETKKHEVKKTGKTAN